MDRCISKSPFNAVDNYSVYLWVKHKTHAKAPMSCNFWAGTSTAVDKIVLVFESEGKQSIPYGHQKKNTLEINFIIAIRLSKLGCCGQVFQIIPPNLKHYWMLLWAICQKSVLEIGSKCTKSNTCGTFNWTISLST